jgi:hypothetical protein
MRAMGSGVDVVVVVVVVAPVMSSSRACARFHAHATALTRSGRGDFHHPALPSREAHEARHRLTRTVGTGSG